MSIIDSTILVRVGRDKFAIELALNLPTGTELGKTHRIEPIYDNSNNSRTQYPDRKDHKEVRYNIETRTYMGDDREM